MNGLANNMLGSFTYSGYTCATCGYWVPYNQYHVHDSQPAYWTWLETNSTAILEELKSIRRLLEDREGLKGL